jgi:hypothetical protein
LSTPRSFAPILAASLLGLALLAGCATRKPAGLPTPEPPPLPEPARVPPTARLEAGSPASLDQYRLKLPFILVLANPGSSPISIESLDCSLLVEGAQAGAQSPGAGAGRRLEGGASLSIPFEFSLDLRELSATIAAPEGPAEGSWEARARIGLAREGGERLGLNASTSGSFPIVREPRFSILSIRVERDLLVTTQLALGLEIHNPNSFPIEFKSFDYDFYGEGRIWSNGTDEVPALIPAGQSLRRGIRFTMNFADMDRRLFDLVAKLRVLRYRLAGEARIATGLDFLPEFVSRFDREGSCAVER